MSKDIEKNDLAAILEAFTKTQAQLVEAMQKTSLGPDQMAAILEKVGTTNAHAMQKAMKPENEQSPLVSCFNPLGDRDHPKEKLHRKTFLNGYPEHDSDTNLNADRLMQAEVDSYNALGQALEQAPQHRLEARNGLYKAELRNRDTELHIEVPVAHLDVRSNLPPTLIMLNHEIATGESMMDLNALLAEVTRLRLELQMRGGGQAQPVRAIGQAPTITAKGGPLVKDLEAALDATPVSQLTGA